MKANIVSVDGTCDLDETTLTSNSGCEANSHRAMSLWAMRNHARFIQRFYAAITDVFDTGALSIGDIIDTFIGSGGDEFDLGPQAWLIIVGGAVAATTSFIPFGGAAAAGMVSGVLGVGVGIFGGVQEATVDPRFTTFADFQDRLGDMKLETQTGIGAYFDSLFRNSPPNGDPAGTALFDSLSSGEWAEQDMAKLEITKGEMVRQMHAAIITEAWNSQQVILLKWSNGLLNDINGVTINPCWEDPGWGSAGIDVFVACENDSNYLIVRPLSPHSTK